jgi:hypothetical protein
VFFDEYQSRPSDPDAVWAHRGAFPPDHVAHALRTEAPSERSHSDGAFYAMALPYWIVAALALASTAVALYILWNLGVG